jgi:uncharacterized membrane protein YeaQ/YmgE (transglycosylase-associated protein family)
MTIIAWVMLGLIAGFIASKIVEGSGVGLSTNLVLGVVGAFVGGGMFQFLGATGVTGFNLRSLFVAIVGAVVVLVAYHALSSRNPSGGRWKRTHNG